MDLIYVGASPEPITQVDLGTMEEIFAENWQAAFIGVRLAEVTVANDASALSMMIVTTCSLTVASVCFGQGVRARAEHHQLEHWQHMQLVITQSGTFLRPPAGLQRETPVEARPKRHYCHAGHVEEIVAFVLGKAAPPPGLTCESGDAGGPRHMIMCMIVYQLSACCRFLSPPPFDRTWNAESGYIVLSTIPKRPNRRQLLCQLHQGPPQAVMLQY